MAQTQRVVIIGGHGKIALLAAPKLVSAGFAVDSLIRQSEHRSDVQQTGATPVLLDIETASVEDLAAVFRGATAVVFSAGAGGGNPARTHAVDFEAAARSIQAAEQAEVSRFVLVSYSRALTDVDTLDPEHSFYPYAKAKHEADAYLRGSNLDYTILGPGMLTLDDASGKIVLADARGEMDGQSPATTNTSRENVAEVITHVVAQPVAVRQTVNFFDGPVSISEAIR